jgi:hypothetical protein
VNVGVMVDVPWPWWVTTTGAIALALVSGAALWRVRNAAVRGALALFAAQCCVTAAVAPFLMPSEARDGVGMTPAHRTTAAVGGADGGMGMPMTAGERGDAATSRLPFTFAFTRRERMAGDVRYEPHGRAVAAASNGSTIALTGGGGWDATTGLADGGGSYELADGSGGFERGSWRARRFVSFLQLPGSTRPRPPRSAPFSGRLEVEVALEGHGTAILTAWSAMSAEARRALGHRLDGFTLLGAKARFTDPRPNWRTTARGEFEGAVMFFGSERGENERR